jgi:K(+)-stimulated pyrophosphate-energized sodium pump
MDAVTFYAIKLLLPLSGLLGLFLAYNLYNRVVALPDGNDRMREISSAIRDGAIAYLRQQATYLAIFIIIAFLAIWWALKFPTAIAFVIGAGTSLVAGFGGMRAATMANVRTAHAASEKQPGQALMVAFNGGAVMGLSVASLGLLGVGLLFLVFGTPEHHEPLVGFAMGASIVALFARIGGGIYTKAADVGSDLVGKVEAGIPEDDPRNPGVIADNVGDNVGDVAGMGADIFESYVTCVIGCLALAATCGTQVLKDLTDFGGLFTGAVGAPVPDAATERWYRMWLMITPLGLSLVGALASFVSIKSMQTLKDGDPAAALRKTTLIASVLFVVLSLGMFLITPVDAVLWWTVLFGTLCGIGIGLITEYYTSSRPVYEIINACKTGPATCVINGIAVGFRSVAIPTAFIVIAVLVSYYFGGVYGVALAGVAMLSTVGIIMTIDAYGPIADNAGGISEMAHLGTETRAITDKLDALGNTTAAIGKGFAIGSAGLAALSVFGAYTQTLEKLASEKLPTGTSLTLDLSITNPMLVAGSFIGAILPCLVVAFTMKSVGRAASLIVTEIRRQFREIAGLLEGKEGVKPDVARCVEISTKAALNEMLLPGFIAFITSILTGVILGPEALAGLLLGTTVVGVVLGIFMSNTGGAWDNAKKFIEQGLVEGEKKGSDAHKAAVVGDTVGDPFKDTSGPSLNILIKMVSILSLLIAPLLV